MAPRVSVIIPCYQQAHFLADAVDSALAQSHRPLDVTVVDDGSTDATPKVAAAFPDVCFVRQRNQGAAAARNAGLRASHGEYVVFLDADDRLLPGAAATGVAALEAHAAAALAVGRYRRIAVDGTPLPTPRRAPVGPNAYESMVRRCWMGVPEVMFRRTALTAVGGFDQRLRCAEDYDLYLRITQRFPIVDHYAEVAEYRQYPGTVSRNPERMLIATLAVLEPHRPRKGATPALRSAWRARENVVWYYERLLEAVVDDVAHGRWVSAARRLLIFARYVPRHPDYARRRARSLLRLSATKLLRAPV